MSAATAKDYRGMSAAIAAALGPAWSAKATDHPNRIELSGPRGRGMELHWEGWNQEGRVRVTGTYPAPLPGVDRPSGYKGQALEWPEASFSIERSPDAIARDIERRILPAYAKAFLIIEERVRTAAHEHAECVALEARLCDAAGGLVTDRNSSAPHQRRGDGYGFHIYRNRQTRCKFYHAKDPDGNEDTIDLSMRVTPQLAEAILRLFR